MSQYYEAQVHDIFVIKGNSAIFKCNLPSFVSDHLEVISWEDTKGNKFSSPDDNNFGTNYFRIKLPAMETYFRASATGVFVASPFYCYTLPDSID